LFASPPRRGRNWRVWWRCGQNSHRWGCGRRRQICLSTSPCGRSLNRRVRRQRRRKRHRRGRGRRSCLCLSGSLCGRRLDRCIELDLSGRWRRRRRRQNWGWGGWRQIRRLAFPHSLRKGWRYLLRARSRSQHGGLRRRSFIPPALYGNAGPAVALGGATVNRNCPELGS